MTELFGIFIFGTILEITLMHKWNPAYYRNGITTFRRVIPIRSLNITLPSEEMINKRFKRRRGKTLTFKKLSKRELAFRDTYAVFDRTTPVMHGYIRLSPEERSIIVKGYLNIFFAIFMLLVIYILGDSLLNDTQNKAVVLFFPIIILLTVRLYYIQARRYGKVCKYLEMRFSKTKPL